MTRRVIVRDAVVLFGFALVVRIGAALLVDAPPYVDAAYTTLVAERLAGGHGFTVPALWSFLEVGGYLPSDPTLPVASNAHWMPLSSIVAAAGMALFGPGWRAGQVFIVPLAAALVPLTYIAGTWLYRSRGIALGGAALALMAGPMLVMAPLIESLAVFGVAGALALLAACRAVVSDRPGAWLVASGALCGVATLARVDGALLVVGPAFAWFQLRRRLGGSWASFGWGLASAGACLAVMAPWLVRNVAEFGAALPSAGGHTLWIRSYNEQFSIASNPSPATYFGWGLPAVVASKLGSLVEVIGRATTLVGGIFVIGLVVEAWRSRMRPVLVPFVAYLGVMVAAMAIVFTFHAPKGAFYHHAWAWLPIGLPMAVAGMRPAAMAAARMWPFLRRQRAQALLIGGGLVGAVVLSLAASATLLVTWRAERAPLVAAATFLNDQAGGGRVLAYDAASLALLTGRQVVAPPFDPFDIVSAVVDAYDVRWVVVTLRPGEATDPLNLWGGSSATDINGSHPSFMPADPAFEAERVRVYAVPAQD